MSTVRKPRVRREQDVRADDSSKVELYHSFQNDQQPVMATNTGVRLACTMAAMLSPFAIFLCWAEKESRVIRRFAVQSAALLAVHILGGAVLGLTSFLVGSVPYFGFLMTLLGWLIYIADALVVLFLRIKLMESAWHGRRYNLPLLERLIRKFY